MNAAYNFWILGRGAIFKQPLGRLFEMHLNG